MFARMLAALFSVCLCATVCGEPPVSQQPLVILIGGFDSDPSAGQIAGTAPRGFGNSGLYQFADDLKSQRLMPEYFNWNGTRAGKLRSDMPPLSEGIAEYVRRQSDTRPEQRLVIVGNSWGGHTACEVCESLNKSPAVAIDLLVLLDPSSTGRDTPMPRSLPVNIKQVTNYSTRNLFVWRKWLDEERISHIDLGDPEIGYLTPERKYAATFDFQAHVAAEWDERIHNDIKRRILDITTPAARPE